MCCAPQPRPKRGVFITLSLTYKVSPIVILQDQTRGGVYSQRCKCFVSVRSLGGAVLYFPLQSLMYNSVRESHREIGLCARTCARPGGGKVPHRSCCGLGRISEGLAAARRSGLAEGTAGVLEQPVAAGREGCTSEEHPLPAGSAPCAPWGVLQLRSCLW